MWFFGNSVPHYHGKGKVVVLSGCDHGIGNATAKQLSSLGYTVIAGCLTDEGARKLQEEVTGIRAEKCDVTKTEDVARLVSIVEREYSGKLHALINNAGIVTVGQAVIVSLEASEKVVAINFLGTMRMTKMFLPLLIDNAGSRVVFLSSIFGLCPAWGLSAYCASKFGVEGYARVLRDELRVFDVQVSVVNPSGTDTSMMQNFVQSAVTNFERCPEGIKKLFGLDYADRSGGERSQQYTIYEPWTICKQHMIYESWMIYKQYVIYERWMIYKQRMTHKQQDRASVFMFYGHYSVPPPSFPLETATRRRGKGSQQ